MDGERGNTHGNMASNAHLISEILPQNENAFQVPIYPPQHQLQRLCTNPEDSDLTLVPSEAERRRRVRLARP
jgi:hypothetical protein